MPYARAAERCFSISPATAEDALDLLAVWFAWQHPLTAGSSSKLTACWLYTFTAAVYAAYYVGRVIIAGDGYPGARSSSTTGGASARSGNIHTRVGCLFHLHAPAMEMWSSRCSLNPSLINTAKKPSAQCGDDGKAQPYRMGFAFITTRQPAHRASPQDITTGHHHRPATTLHQRASHAKMLPAFLWCIADPSFLDASCCSSYTQ